MKSMRELIDALDAILVERVEMIRTDVGQEAAVLINPGRGQFAAMMSKWHGARCLIERSTGTLYLGDAYHVYHYQMCMELGLKMHECASFIARADAIKQYSFFEEDKPLIVANPNVRRLWGNKPSFAEFADEGLNEKVQMLSQGHKNTPCLINPSRGEFDAFMGKWANGSRCMLDEHGSLYMCDAYEAYHYQMARELGVNFDTATVFYGYPDHIGMDLDPHCQNRVFRERVEKAKVMILGNKHVQRIWGADVIVRNRVPD